MEIIQNIQTVGLRFKIKSQKEESPKRKSSPFTCLSKMEDVSFARSVYNADTGHGLNMGLNCSDQFSSLLIFESQRVGRLSFSPALTHLIQIIN